MGKENFLKLCNELRPYIQKRSTNLRSSISFEKRVAVTLYYFVFVKWHTITESEVVI